MANTCVRLAGNYTDIYYTLQETSLAYLEEISNTQETIMGQIYIYMTDHR